MLSTFLVQRRFGSSQGRRAYDRETVLLLLSPSGIATWSSGTGALEEVVQWGALWTVRQFDGGFGIHIPSTTRAGEETASQGMKMEGRAVAWTNRHLVPTLSRCTSFSSVPTTTFAATS